MAFVVSFRVMNVTSISASVVLLGLIGCTRASRPEPPRPSTVTVGQCADPARDGVTSAQPDFRLADRDLNGDGTVERIVADKSLCSDGNCHWNLFWQERADCWRYLGTIAAKRLQRQDDKGEARFADLNGWWSFGSRRYLLSRYRFRHDGYRVVDTLICREQEDDRILCAPDEGRGELSR